MEKFLFEELKNPISKIACTRANQRAETWTTVIQFIVAKIAPQFTMLPKFIMSLLVYSTTLDSSSRTDTLTLPLPMWLVHTFIHSCRIFQTISLRFPFPFDTFRFPFDVKNLVGYLIACVLEYTMVSYVFYFIACIISLAIGSFVMLLGLINDLNDNLKTINENVKTNGTHFQTVCQLYEFVQFHSEAKQLSTRLSNRYLVRKFKISKIISNFILRLVQDFSAIFQPILMVS